MKSIKSQPVIFIIFGGTGDLNSRKITPALYNLFLDGWLPDQFCIVGTGRTKLTDEEFRSKLLEGNNQFSRSGKADEKKWEEFASHISYISSDVKDAGSFAAFTQKIKEQEESWKAEANIIYYLAVAPQFFPIIAENISKNSLCENIA